MAEKHQVIKASDRKLSFLTKRTPFDVFVLLLVMFMAVNNVGWWIFDDEEETTPEVKKEEVQPQKEEVPAPEPAKPVVEKKKAEVKPQKVEVKKEEEKKAVVEKKETKKAVKKETKKAVTKGGGGATSPVQYLPASQVPVKPITAPDLKAVQPSKAPTVYKGGAAAPKTYNHVTAEMLTGKKPAKLPESIRIQQKAEKEMEDIQKSMGSFPNEVGMDKSNPIGQITLANGIKVFIEYDKNNSPIKVAYLYKDGKKVVKALDKNGRAETIIIDGKKMSVKYTDKPEGQTEISFIDSKGNVFERRLYSENGLILELENKQTGRTYRYNYEFEEGIAVSYTKTDSSGKRIAQGDISDIEDIHMKTFFFSSGTGEGAVRSFTYMHDDKGRVVKIIENQNTDNEIVRFLDDKSRLVKLQKKSTGVVYEYKYDDQNRLAQITVTNADGETRVLKPGDPEFDIFESETEQFDPVEFGKTIMEHRQLMDMTDRNVLQQNVNEIKSYKGLPSAQEMNSSSAKPVKVEAPSAVSSPSVSIPVRAPSNQATSAAAASRVPAKAPARIPSKGPSVPGR